MRRTVHNGLRYVSEADLVHFCRAIVSTEEIICRTHQRGMLTDFQKGKLSSALLIIDTLEEEET